jgi:hypothetical protein
MERGRALVLLPLHYMTLMVQNKRPSPEPPPHAVLL